MHAEVVDQYSEVVDEKVYNLIAMIIKLCVKEKFIISNGKLT